MLFRNLVSMDVEESIRGNPIDGVVLLCGCDKTTPSLIMGAASCDLPALVVSGGPMLNGKFRGSDDRIGHRRLAVQRGGQGRPMSLKEFMQAESCMSRSTGTCNVMGTASTMASMVEALGLSAAAERGDSGGRLAPLCAGAPGRPPHRRARAAGRPDLADPDARGVRERDPRQRRRRRLDQRRHPPAGDRRTRRRRR